MYSWQHPIIDNYIRYSILDSMFELVTLKPTKLSYNKLKYLCTKVEIILYKKSKSLYEYSNIDTLRYRMKDTTIKLIELSKTLLNKESFKENDMNVLNVHIYNNEQTKKMVDLVNIHPMYKEYYL